MNSTSLKKILILVTILAVPGFLYYLLQEKGKNRYKPLPYFGPKVPAKTFHTFHGEKIQDTIYHQVANFKLINQHADTVGFEAYQGKIIVLNLFSAKTGSEFISKAVKAFETTYGKNRMISFVSLTSDPAHDTPEVLTTYAAKLNAEPGKWDFLTGDSIEVYSLMKKELRLDPNSNLLVLLDPQHHIRGYYDVTRQENLSQLDDEIKVLITEELRKITAKDGR
ncbi:SCO family protein [Pedobacter sp. MC2016-14]|uniref:SCO family protein n=1 Tax=Pedobacter sp. MC2016-14 TaxID=2897327 RepID=UPI001E3A2F40|nr:SCO family protein [Pedobacter sp. MC2016-14]MCD0487693.1 SCO family protein [Pedobacter sp. MC2016-14]